MTDKGFSKIDKNIELLAPAGSKESFYAGIGAGADAVYLAYEKFGARAYAGNFSLEDITECIDIAHLYGKKVYLTVNTLVKEKEFEELDEFAQSGIPSISDGLIIQDLGVASFFKDNYPLIPLHASTQMSITGAKGAALLQTLGFSRIVPARELSFDEIRDIHDRTGLEIECFVHGAMCYSYSGQCLFSSVLGGRSGNRGRCAQPCRLSYRIQGSPKDTETYPLSLKDMCTLEILPKILDSGVCSLKVEGRMKPAEYVEGVISVYRKYIDLYLSGDEYAVDKNDLKKLSELYVRGDLSHGYYDRHNSRDMVTVTSHGYNGSDKDAEKKDIETADTGSRYLPKIKVSFSAEFKIGKEALITAYASTEDGRDASASVKGDIIQSAVKASVSEDDIRKSLKKLGNTPFITDDELISVEIEEGCFYSLKGINELRRSVLSQIRNKLKFDSAKNTEVYDCSGLRPVNTKTLLLKNGLSFLIRTSDQLRAIDSVLSGSDQEGISRVYIEESLFSDADNTEIIRHFTDTSDIPVYLASSFIRRIGDRPERLREYFSEGLLSGVLVRNLEDLASFSDTEDVNIISDFGLYSWNSRAVDELCRYADGCTLPLELSNSECRNLAASTDMHVEKVIYGRAPLMISANCIRKTLKSCTKKSGFETIIDRKGISFPVYADCEHCLNVIYNSVPLILKKVPGICNRIEFTTESRDECEKLIGIFLSGNIPDMPHTSGWAERPVM